MTPPRFSDFIALLEAPAGQPLSPSDFQELKSSIGSKQTAQYIDYLTRAINETYINSETPTTPSGQNDDQHADNGSNLVIPTTELHGESYVTHTHQFESTQQIQLPEPIVTNTETHHRLERRITDHGTPVTLPAPPVHYLTGVTLYGPEAVTVTPTEKYLLGDATGREMSLSHSLAATAVSYNPAEYDEPKQLGTVISLVGFGDSNYFHWIVEHLPKLRAFDYYREQTGETPTILIPGDISSWQQETLELLGYWEYTEPWDGGCATVDRYIFTVGAHPLHEYPYLQPAQLRWLRKQFLSAVQLPETRTENNDTVPANQTVPPGNPGDGFTNNPLRDVARQIRRVQQAIATRMPGIGTDPGVVHGTKHYLISREAIGDRAVQNTSAVQRALPWTFKRIQPEQYSVATQIRLFYDSDVIIAPYGAALTNILWTTPGTHVVILYAPSDVYTPIYYQIATYLGHACAYLQFPLTNDRLLDVDSEIVRDAVSELEAQAPGGVLPSNITINPDVIPPSPDCRY